MAKLIMFGAKSSKGVLDNGDAYDSTKVYLQTNFKDGDNFAGYAVVEYKYGKSDNFENIKDLKLPALVNVDFDTETTGTRSTIIITDITPITQGVNVLNQSSKS